MMRATCASSAINDLQGRESLVVTTLSDAANGSWVYVGHHESYWDQKPKLNPITGKDEWNGTSILNVADPANPKLVWHIPNETNRNSRGVSVVYDYKFDGSGRDYLIRNSEILTEGETGKDLKYQIFDITSRDTDPSKITLVSEITGTPPNSCGPGCGGLFTHRAHKGWWSQDTGYFYAASGEPGFRNVVIQIFDLKDPKAPKFVGRAWLPSQKDGEPGYEDQYAHHPVVDEERKRLYVGYRNSGWTAEFDIADPAHPKLVWSLDMNPPHRGPHTVSPIVYDTVPNFGKEALPRRYAFVVDEAGGTADMAPCPGGVRTGSYMLDITNETKPFPVSVWQVPVGNFCNKGGRFGPHQSAETVNGTHQSLREQDRLARLLQRGHPSAGSVGSVSDEGAGLLHPEDQRALTPDRHGPADGDPDQRRGHRRARSRLRLGSRRHGAVHPAVHEAELSSLCARALRHTEAQRHRGLI